MESWQQNLSRWTSHPRLDDQIKAELQEKADDEQWLIDGFYTNLAFGTGGMRGEIGPGTNRMNVYTVRKASYGLAQFVKKNATEPKVVIAYDSRHFSPEFSLEAAKVLGTEGVQVFLFEALRPTPMLSFAVRHLNADAGIVMTASHNPPEYNGFKVYGNDGGQLPPHPAEALVKEVNSVEDELQIEVKSEDYLRQQGLLNFIGTDIDEAYTKALSQIALQPSLYTAGIPLSVVYTPLHGTGLLPFTQSMKTLGFEALHIVEEQAIADGDFPTVSSPNPEEHAAFEMAISVGDRVDADLLIATDPDADRVGLAVKNDTGEFQVLTGNQTGALLLEYVLQQRKTQGVLPANGIVMKTIVTSELGRAIADSYGLTTEDTLTGFKFIGEKINQYNASKEFQFQFGYEESYGYLIDDLARDKDAIQASVMAVEMALHYKQQGKTLYDALQELFQRYGWYKEGLTSVTRKGKRGAEDIEQLMHLFREQPPETIAGMRVEAIEDYAQKEVRNLMTDTTEPIQLPASNVLKYRLADEAWFCLRPSGTEPKVKFYFGVKEISEDKAVSKLQAIEEDVMALVKTRM
ncbi:phospho-sugar mutase [Aureibacillus halotolerans]|uniref:Phosphoglucomutase n=1 Tax=Aureibacillus halotolerans TaxID=1508390 RepID=A0A4R6TRU3_9BACI|nr:phospho-sugar mutase [Aureibacillus halotolerans]TDQ35422.1 alpha-phosphoglucomutase [Aureibacillus halotolerans]